MNLKHVRESRERTRVNDLLDLAIQHNGKVDTIHIAEKWEIPPILVKQYIDYLVKRYDVPIEQIEHNYPSYRFDMSSKLEFLEVTKDELPLSTGLADVIVESSRETDGILCMNCDKLNEEGNFCGFCGFDLKPTK